MKLPYYAQLAVRYRLESISFITGFCLLAYELAAARVLAPTIGSSTYVWTSVIGVIIAALSLGFFIGGKVADRRNRSTDVGWLLLLAAVAATITLLMYEGVLTGLADVENIDRRVQAVIAALVLFAPTSLLIGMTSPYLAKLRVASLKQTGQSVAALDAFNSIGGIVGTFMTGFVFFGFIGSRETIIVVIVLLILASWFIAGRHSRPGRRAAITFAVVLSLLSGTTTSTVRAISIDTPSANYQVIQGAYNGWPVTGLTTGPGGVQSAVYQYGSDDLVFWYTNTMAEIAIEQRPESVLMLGGGAFTLPQYLSSELPDAQIDVVEIDPELLSISTEYFNFTQPKNVTPIFEDARTYVNQSEEKYDVILVDVYGDASIPFTLMTREFGAALADRLTDGGVVAANFIAGWEGKCRDVFAALDAAYRTELPYVAYLNESRRREARANHVVVYSEAPIAVDGLKTLTPFGQPAYTDNYAPAERLYYGCQALT